MKKFWILGAACLTLCSCGVVSAQTKDVPPTHWAYTAVQQLAQKGLVLGYPDGNFLGNKTITRYEMASLILRAIQQVETIKSQEPSSNSNVQQESKPESATPTVSNEDIETLKKLVDDYKVELTVIGADTKAYGERLDSLEGKVGTIQDQLNDPEGAIQTNLSDVSKLKKVKVSGYIQSRYEAAQDAKDTASGGDSKNKFYVRRARAKVTASVGDKTQGVLEFDAAGSSTVTKSAYIEYDLKGDPALGGSFTLGQMLWPFGYELVQSSSDRETPEYSKIVASLFPGEYDRGVKYSSATGERLTYELGLFNGDGYKADVNDHDQRKDLVGRIRYALTDKFDLGVSGYSGKQAVGAAAPFSMKDRTRYGVDFQYYLPETTIKGEYIQGKTLVGSSLNNVNGWYAQIARNLSAKDTFVVKYDSYNDKNPDPASYGIQNAWNVGLVHWLDNATRLKLFYQINQEQRNSYNNNLFTVELITKF